MSQKKSILKKSFSLPVQVLLVVLLTFFLAPSLPEGFQQFCLSLSLTLKEILLFFLPALIFAFLFLSLSRMKQGVFLFVIILLGAVCLSNFTSTMVAYSSGQLIFHFLDFTFDFTAMSQEKLQPLWHPHLPRWIENEMALFLGFIAGVFSAYMPSQLKLKMQAGCQRFTTIFLNWFFIPLVPIFILGFIIKLRFDGVLFQIFFQYGPLLICIGILQVTYTLFLYGVAALGRFKKWRLFLKNMFPAFVTAFSSMSSAAALPLTLRGTQKNTKDDPLVESIIPATVNVHLIGDSLGVPLMAMGLLLTFNGTLPSFPLYMQFAFYFILIKFAIAAVPGGGIIVMIPILEKYLGFTPEMTGLITAMYILFDSMNTGMNVMGNGAFALIFQKVWRFKNKRTPPHSS